MRQERQDRITLAARELFAALGYDKATLRQIAANAGLGLGTLFNYISDKRDLIYLIFNEEMDSLTDRALAAPRPWQSFVEKILSISEPHYRLFSQDPVLSRILLSEVLLQTPGLHLERYRGIRKRLIGGLGQIVAEAQRSGEIRSSEEPELIARNIFFCISGALRWWLASPAAHDWRAGQREFERIVKLQFAGLAHGEQTIVTTIVTTAVKTAATTAATTAMTTAKRATRSSGVRGKPVPAG